MLVLSLSTFTGSSQLAPDAAEHLRVLRTFDARVASIGDRLATANASLCHERQYQHGLALHDLSQYPRASRREVSALFGLNQGPAVLALADGGAAARAGLRQDDVLISADGSPLPRPAAGVHDSFAPTERMIETLEAAFADGVAELEVRRNGAVQQIRVRAAAGCASRFQVVPSDTPAAKADGRYVQLTTSLVAYTRDNHELASLVAHELAHNILKHRVRLNEAGVDRNALTLSRRDARLFQLTELEADRLAIHLMERAGYNPAAAVRLWTRQSLDPQWSKSGFHPPWTKRIEVMEAEIAVIQKARAEGVAARAPLPDGPLENRLR